MIKKNDVIDEMIGYEIPLKQKKKILKRVHENGEDLMEVCHQRALPSMAFMNDDRETYRYEGENYTADELKKAFPFRKFVLINLHK